MPDFERIGYEAMLACGEIERAKEICALQLQAFWDRLRPQITERENKARTLDRRYAALHALLYDRDIPVNDALMLTHHHRILIVLALVVLTAIACLAGNFTTFYLLGYTPLLTLFLGFGATALPVVIGHFAYEHLVAHNRVLRLGVFLFAAALCGCGLFRLAEARRDTVDKAVLSTTEASTSYVEGSASEPAPDAAAEQPSAEAQVHRSLGDAALWMMLSADLMLGLFVGRFTDMRTDADYAAWDELKKLTRKLAKLNKEIREFTSAYQVAQKDCMTGILKAEQVLNKRRPPYHSVPALTALVLLLVTACSVHAQTIQHYEAILIDTSGSIGKGGPNSELFREYLLSTKKLLLSEPPNTRVWVAAISTDSFGGVQEILKGWTPDDHGIFTDDLNRARRQLAASFAAKSAQLSPTAGGTDIFGALWHVKAVLESSPADNPSETSTTTVWIFSDMMNETKSFVMPALISSGAEAMLEQAKSNGALVSLKGYKIHICGVSTAGHTPQTWEIVRQFWMRYFRVAGSEVVSYSTGCEIGH